MTAASTHTSQTLDRYVSDPHPFAIYRGESRKESKAYFTKAEAAEAAETKDSGIQKPNS